MSAAIRSGRACRTVSKPCDRSRARDVFTLGGWGVCRQLALRLEIPAPSVSQNLVSAGHELQPTGSEFLQRRRVEFDHSSRKREGRGWGGGKNGLFTERGSGGSGVRERGKDTGGGKTVRWKQREGGGLSALPHSKLWKWRGGELSCRCCCRRRHRCC